MTGAGLLLLPAGSFFTVAGLSAGTLMTAATVLGVGASLLSPRPKAPTMSYETLDRLNVTLDPRTPRKAVFGNTAFATDMRDQWIDKISDERTEVHRWIVMAAHPVAGLDEIWFDEEKVWTKENGDDVNSKFKNYMAVTVKLNAVAEDAIQAGPNWAGRRYTGCSYVHIKYTIVKDSPFANNIPTRVTFRGRGAPCYDPRRGGQSPTNNLTWSYDYAGEKCGENPALQLLSWLLGYRINGRLSVGKGIPPDRIDMQSFITAANICDEQITLAAGGTQKRYTAGGIVSEGEDPSSVVDRWKAAMNATLDDVDGQIRLTVLSNDLAAPVYDFVDTDVLGDYIWKPSENLAAAYNIVRGSYVDPSNESLYQTGEYPEVKVESLDGIDRIETADYSFVQVTGQAQRLSKTRLQRSLYPGTFQAEFQMTGWRVQKGDCVTLTFNAAGFAQKLFRVIEIEMRADGVCPMTLREEHEAIYEWMNDDIGEPTRPAPTVYGPNDNPLIYHIGTVETGADVTGDHTAANTLAVGNMTADYINLTLDDILLDVAALEDAYGPTASAAGSAEAAAAAQAAAEAARDVALNAQNNATAAQDMAIAARNAAQTAEQNAISQANAAGGFASTAMAYRDEAAGSVTAAQGHATTAQTAATNASASSSSAATSATNASGSASQAATSATTAASAGDAARLTAAMLLPADFSQGGSYWFFGYDGDPATRTPIASGATYNSATFTFPVVDGVGAVMQAAGDAAVSYRDVSAVGVAPVRPERRYRATARIRCLTDDAGTGGAIYIIGSGADFIYIAGASVSIGLGAFTAGVWKEVSVEMDGTSAVNAGGANIRPLMRIPGSAATWQVQTVRLEDITQQHTAAGSATAAANSASSAAASQTEAGNSAGAAQVSATDAATSAGAADTSASNANTYAGQASTSASNAAASASTASTHAGNASTSATNASNSATAASNSASIASTHATDAAQSATAASGSATNAATSASNASTSASQASTSATNASGSASAAQTSATNASNSASNASSSATAASNSASSASTASTDAGNFATSASGHANTASTHASNASSSASSASTSASTASNQAAAAQNSATLAASIGRGGINSNPIFSSWPVIADPPTSWSVYGDAYATSRGTVSGAVVEGSSYYVTHPVAAGQNRGYSQSIAIGPGWYVIEATVKLASGTWQGSGLYANFGSVTGQINFQTEPDTNGVTENSSASTKYRRFSKLVQNTGTATTGDFYLMSGWTGFGTVAVKTIQWYRATIRPASAAEISAQTAIPSLQATVSNHSGVITTLEGRALAYWQQVVNAGIGNGSTAFVELRAESTFGAGAVSTIAMGARELHVYNPTASGWSTALTVASGNVTVNGNLNVGGSIYLAGNFIRLGLQQFTVSASDGQAVSFNGDLGAIPHVSFNINALPALGAGETYDIQATNLTTTGFTMRAKILSAGSGGSTSVTSTNGVSTSGTPLWKMHKTDAADAVDGRYTFTATGNVYLTGTPGAGGYSDSQALQFGCYVRSGGVWTKIGSMSTWLSGSFTGTKSGSISNTFTFSGAIGQTADYEFGVHLEEGDSITAFNSVVYMKPTGTAGTTTSVAQPVSATITPQNAT